MNNTMTKKPTAQHVKDWAQKHPDGIIIAVGATAVGATLVFGGALAATATMSALIATASGVILIEKLPRRLGDEMTWLPEWLADIDAKAFLLRHQLLIDIGFTIGTFLCFPGVTGILAAGLAGIFVSIGLKLLQLTEREALEEIPAKAV